MQFKKLKIVLLMRPTGGLYIVQVVFTRVVGCIDSLVWSKGELSIAYLQQNETNKNAAMDCTMQLRVLKKKQFFLSPLFFKICC